MKPLLLFICFLVAIQSSYAVIIHEDYCAEHPKSVQCRVFGLTAQEEKAKNEKCDPIGSKDCKLYDLIDDKIASCGMQHTMYQGRSLTDNTTQRSSVAKCFTGLSAYRNVYKSPVYGDARGDIKCLPNKYKMKLICGEKGSRCVCKGGTTTCRCQWYTDLCSLDEVCEGHQSCLMSHEGVICKGGSINQCHLNPRLCQNKNSYCVDLPDKDMVWRNGLEVIGEGFTCIQKDIFKKLKISSPFCNFNRTDHKLGGAGFVQPQNSLDSCCYNHLACVKRRTSLGGYLFKSRPCYCNVLFRICLKVVSYTKRMLRSQANALISIVNDVKLCTLGDSGACNPSFPGNCHKGDLIDPSIAHCKINCKTGPLLPIEKRSCRIRKCIPPNNQRNTRVIDVPTHRESSLCEAVEGLPVTCGFKDTRCVCDGKPTKAYFTHGCRCQFWPLA